MSCVEVYNENVYDLIALTDKKESLPKDGDVWDNACTREVRSRTDVEELLLEAKKKRFTKVTNRNEHSSRSHFILQFRIFGTHENGNHLRGALNLIDLAGSENANAARDNQQKQEGSYIRQSLLTLERVLNCLQKGTKAPFRDSRLTQLLKDSLTGTAKVVMFLNVSPEEECLDETKKSLNFGKMVNNVTLGQAKKLK
jgi:kinesin family protein C1